MKLKAIFIGVALLFSAQASAQTVTSFGYYNAHENDLDVDLGVLVGSVGYQFAPNDAIRIVPEVRGGIGVTDESILGAEIKIRNVVAAALRVELAISEPVYLYTVSSYGEYEFKAEDRVLGSATVSDDDFGFGGGVGFNASQELAFEAGYEDVGGLDVFNASVRVRF